MADRAMPLEPSVRLLEQAAQWYAALRDENAPDADRVAWKAWLAQSPDHAAAWAHIESVCRRFEPLRGCGPQGTAAAVAGVEAARSTTLRRRQALKNLAGVAGLGVLAWASWRYTPLPGLAMALRADQSTATGERRDLALADGSRVWLNTRTSLQVDYRSDRRRLVLLDGEILVQTALDGQQRPFYVETSHGRLDALGTRFNVRHAGDRTRLDVFEHAVEIRTHGNAVLRVGAGEAAAFDDRSISVLGAADPMREAWSRGRIPADNLPLGELLQEIGRYKTGYIRVAPEVAGLKVMGVYPADDADRALELLAQALPIRITRSLPWWTTVEAR